MTLVSVDVTGPHNAFISKILPYPDLDTLPRATADHSSLLAWVPRCQKEVEAPQNVFFRSLPCPHPPPFNLLHSPEISSTLQLHLIQSGLLTHQQLQLSLHEFD